MKRLYIYGSALLIALGLVFFSMKFVSSGEAAVKHSRDTIQQGNGPEVVNPNSADVKKCGEKHKCCCCNKGGEKKCTKENKNGGDVEIGKNPNLNAPDTIKSNIVPQEDKK